MKILVCIVTYGIHSRLEKAIESVEQSDVNADLHIVVVDNFESGRDEVPYENENRIRMKYPSLEYMHTGRNAGYGAAANTGFKYCSGSSYDYFIVMNDDVQVEKNTLKILQQQMKFRTLCLAGPQIVRPDGTLDGPCRFMSIWRKYILLPFMPFIYPFHRHFFDDRLQVPTPEPYRLNGALLCFDAEGFQKLGMFDEQVFLFAEEMILAEKIKKHGLKQGYVQQCRVQHRHSSTIDMLMSPAQKEKQKFRSNLYYFRAYLGVSDLFLFLAGISFYVYLYLIFIPYKTMRAHSG